jgi:hypothetical protein
VFECYYLSTFFCRRWADFTSLRSLNEDPPDVWFRNLPDKWRRHIERRLERRSLQIRNIPYEKLTHGRRLPGVYRLSLNLFVNI